MTSPAILRMSALGTAILGMLLSGAALAFDYRVDSVGGPANLADEVAAAVALWAEDGALEAEQSEEARNVFGYGRAERFGPDAHSLTVARGSGAEREVRVLLRPNLGDLARSVLLHEVGILAGLPEAESGVMNPRLGPGHPDAPTTEELERLETLGAFAPEDINRDGVVDFYDLIALARAFGQTGVNLPADINQDGVVDEADLALLEAAYTFAPPAETPPAGLEEAPMLPGEHEDFGDEFLGDEFFEDEFFEDDPFGDEFFEDEFFDDPFDDDPFEDDPLGD